MTLLRLFVYGSLKRGFANHDRYCRGVCSMEEADIEGRLFQMPTGYPVLRIPETRVLARGSENVAADIEMQERLAAEVAAAARNRTSLLEGVAGRVHGVVLTFANAVERLRAIDGLEEFRPGRLSRYDRVLIAVRPRLAETGLPVWTYIAGDLSPRGREIPTARWPKLRYPA